jgi:colanic acid biosynthesis protein WcaH
MEKPQSPSARVAGVAVAPAGMTRNQVMADPVGPLERSTFRTVVAHAPLVAIDLLVTSADGQVLLGLRRNAPAKNYWFVPGGRIYKGERIGDAFRRISRTEIGIDIRLEGAEFSGVFEHFYEDNFTDAPGFGTHYVILAYRMQLPAGGVRPSEVQHAAYRWISVSELLGAADVHPHVKTYFARAPDRAYHHPRPFRSLA